MVSKYIFGKIYILLRNLRYTPNTQVIDAYGGIRM